MAGEENLSETPAEAMTGTVSVPHVAGPVPVSVPETLAGSNGEETAPTEPANAGPPPNPDLAPYSASTRWGPWAALAAVVCIMAFAIAVALGGWVIEAKAFSGGSGVPRGAKILLAMLLAQSVMIIGIVAAAGAKGDRRVTALALKPPVGGFWAYVRTLAFTLAAVGIYTAVTAIAFSHDPGQDLGEMAGIFRGPWWPLALVVIGAGAPLSEELMFRGFLQTALVPTRLGYWGAALVTTSIWTSLHAGYSLVGLGEVFMIGLVFAVFLRRRGSLRVTLMCHAIYNSAIALVMIFAPKDVLGF